MPSYRRFGFSSSFPRFAIVAFLVMDALTVTVSAASTSLQFVPVTPCRIMDTRGFGGLLGGPYLSARATRNVPIPASSCNVPPAAAYAVKIAVIPRAGRLGYLTAWPTGQPQPLISTLNSPDGSILANAAIVLADANGSISVFVTDDTDLVIDINGYFAPQGTGTLQFYPLPPCRVVDTRNASSPLGGPTMNANTSRTFPLASSACDLPATAAAYSLNFAVVPQGPLGTC